MPVLQLAKPLPKGARPFLVSAVLFLPLASILKMGLPLRRLNPIQTRPSQSADLKPFKWPCEEERCFDEQLQEWAGSSPQGRLPRLGDLPCFSRLLIKVLLDLFPALKASRSA